MRRLGRNDSALQGQFDARRMADRIESVELRSKLAGIDRRFVAQRDMFFLATLVARVGRRSHTRTSAVSVARRALLVSA